ncbi:rhamnose ABC transporter substrate-binding protein [Okibacterium endophyticum]
MKHVTKGLIGASVAAVALLAFTACAGDSSDGGAAAACLDAPAKVGFVNKLDTDPYWGETKNGAEAAKADLGGDLIITAPSKDTGDAQVEFINNLIAQDVDVIVIAGNNPDTVAPALKRAEQAGIRVMSYDSDVATDARTIFVSQADLGDVGTTMLKTISEQIGGEGQIAALIDNATATNQVQWVQAVEDAIANDPEYSGIELVTTVYGESNETTSQQQALGLVNSYPDLKGIIVPSGLGFPAAARALESAGETDIKMTGLAPASIMKSYIESGQATDVWWNVHDLGYLTYAAAQALAQCEITGATGESFDAGDLGEFTVGDDGVVILGPTKLVTAENVEEFKF